MHEAALKKKPAPSTEPPAAARRSERPKAPPLPAPGLHTAGPAAVPFPLPAEPEAAAEAPGREETAPEEEASDAGGKKRLADVLGRVDKTARRQKGPAARASRAKKAAGKAAADASAAAPSPAEEPLAKGKAGQIEVMNDPKKKGAVEKEDFLELVRKKLRQMEMPSNPSQMAKFKEKGGASGLKSELVGGVEAQKQKSMGGLQAAAGAQPKPAEKRVPAHEPAMDPGPGAGPLDARDVLPQPKTEAEVSLDADRDEMEGTLERERLSPSRLRKANDPRFDAVQDGREEVHTRAAAGPAAYRAEESAYLAEQGAAVLGDEKTGRGAMRATRRHAGAKVHGAQRTQMSAEEAKRKKFVADVDAVYAKTKKTVDDKLLWLDGEVDRRFTDGEAGARQEFEEFVDREFRAWKSRRYSGGRGKLRWIGDRFRDINNLSGAKKVYTDGQDLYYEKLDSTIKNIGTLIDTTLDWCLEETRKGDERVREYFKNLDDGVKTLVSDAVAAALDRFGDLKSRVEDHREELADKLVQRYQESREKLDARIEEIKQSHRSLYVRVKRKIAAVIEAIRNFKNRLMAILSRAASVVEMILDDPIDFLTNLLRAVKTGFNQFSAKIWEHLKQGVFGWLFGTLSGIGIQVPKDFSAKSVFGLILQVAGVTYDNVRERAVKIVGARNVEAVERLGGYLSTLFSEGPAGLWEELKGDLGDLKDTVLDAVRDWVVTRIVTAAVVKLVSLFNPVGAIVQAVLAIYNVVRFFIERIDQILELVSSIVDSLALIVRGNVQAAADAIERSLALTIPLIISFLARLLNVGGVAQRVQKIIQRVRRRINRAIDKMIRKVAARILSAAGKVTTAAKRGIQKFLEWWKIKKTFRQNGETHTLYFDGADPDGNLMMASNPMALVKYVSLRFQGRTSESEPKKPVSPSDGKILKKVANELAQLDRTRHSVNAAIDQPAADYYKEQKSKGKAKVEARSLAVRKASIGQDRGEKVAGSLTRIAGLLSKLSGSVESRVRPPTRIRYGPTRVKLEDGQVSEDGRIMEARPLSLHPGDNVGSEPQSSAQSLLWRRVSQRKQAYVRGHLLNHNLHGPGIVKNMTPIPGADNTRMEPYERIVKDAVFEQNLVVRYFVVAKYDDHGDREEGIADERHVPTSIRLQAQKLKLKDGAGEDEKAAQDPANWVKDDRGTGNGLPMDVNLPITLPTGPVEGRRVTRIDLSQAHSVEDRVLVEAYLYKNLTTIGKARAEILLDSKPKTVEELEALEDGNGRRFVTKEVIEQMEKNEVHLSGGTRIEEAAES